VLGLQGAPNQRDESVHCARWRVHADLGRFVCVHVRVCNLSVSLQYLRAGAHVRHPTEWHGGMLGTVQARVLVIVSCRAVAASSRSTTGNAMCHPANHGPSFPQACKLVGVVNDHWECFSFQTCGITTTGTLLCWSASVCAVIDDSERRGCERGSSQTCVNPSGSYISVDVSLVCMCVCA
jgi:hypothetical protein